VVSLVGGPTPRLSDILVVDDDAPIRDLMVEFLEMEGYAVRAARHGLEALQLVRAQRPDVVLLDLMMPEMNGQQFAEACREEPGLAGLPIVLMSAAPEGADVSSRIGARAHMRKPFDLDRLSQVLERLK
jgi:two-component system alkaline phosphatase synthesis response regulator PhoP